MQLSKSRILLSAILLVIAGSLSLVPVFAQGTDTVITIGVQSWQQDFLDDEAFDAFEEAHPGVDVVIVVIDDDTRYFATPTEADEVEDYITNVNALAAEADLLPLELYGGARLSTRAGMYLDINPLMNADPMANVEDFYPPMLQSLQWDGGTWGLPMSGSIQVVTYDRNKFDEAGLAYPDTSWTLDNFINAGEVLTEFDDEGNITVPGFFGFDTAVLLASLLNSDLSDPASFPSLPDIVTPETIQMLEQWATFEADYSPDFSQGFNFDFYEIPLGINDTFILNDEFNVGPEDADFQGVLLPGGRAGLQVQAYGISAGTHNPQLAYELLQYMTQTPEIAYSFFGDSPARQSLLTADTSDLPIFRPDMPEEIQGLIDDALANAIPQSELEFVRYVAYASSRVNDEEEPMDAETALLDYQEQLIEVYTAIAEQAGTSVIEVATPVPTPVLQSGEVALTFGVETFYGPNQDNDLWQDAIDEFVAQDSQVGHIVVDTGYYSLEERAEEQDCFYLSSNTVTTADLTLLFTVDPFLTTDANLDMGNFINGTLDQITRDGAMWAVPLSITPSVMWYSPELFEEAGLPAPSNDWTISEFVEVLNTLDSVTDGAPYTSESFGATYLYQLIAAYGGTPIDYSTTPYTINVDDPATIEAIRQVLSLAQDDLINYQELGNFGGGGGFFGGNRALTDAILLPNDYRIQNRGDEFGNSLRVVMFPRGANTIPVSYDMGIGMISANTPAPDACYRWLSFLSRRGELLTGMPAQSDMFEQAVANITDADDIVALYQAFSDALASPELVLVPGQFSGSSSDPVVSVGNFLRQNWINTAFDSIVLDDVDIETALTDAQLYINDYDQCVTGIELLDRPLAQLSEEESQDYFRQFLQCAVDVDPSLEEQFSYALNDDEDE